MFVRELPELAEDKETTALLAYLNASGQLRKGLLSAHRARQERLSPTPVFVEETPLFEVKSIRTGTDERAVANMPNNLDFKSGRVRHNFSDGYDALKVITWYTPTQKIIEPISMLRFNASTEDDPIALILHSIWKISDTTFGMTGTNTNDRYIQMIQGIRHLLTNPSALQFRFAIGDAFFRQGEQGLFALPAAIGGTPPYTYRLIGTLPSGLIYDSSALEIRGSLSTNTIAPMQWEATDAIGTQIRDPFLITSYAPLTLPSADFNDGSNVGAFRSSDFPITRSLGAASGGVPPYTYSVGFGSAQDRRSIDNTISIQGILSNSGQTITINVGDFRSGTTFNVTMLRHVQDSIGQLATALITFRLRED